MSEKPLKKNNRWKQVFWAHKICSMGIWIPGHPILIAKILTNRSHAASPHSSHKQHRLLLTRVLVGNILVVWKERYSMFTLYTLSMSPMWDSYAPIQFALLHSGDRNPGFYTDHCLKKTTKFKIDLPGYQLMFRLHLVLSSF